MEKIKEILKECAQSLGLEKLELDAEGNCFLFFDDLFLVQISTNENSPYLYLKANIPFQVETISHKKIFLEKLLEGNFLGTENEGVALGINEFQSENILLLLPIALEKIEYPRFEKKLESFVNVLEHWYNKVPKLIEESSAPSSSFAAPEFAMRV